MVRDHTFEKPWGSRRGFKQWNESALCQYSFTLFALRKLLFIYQESAVDWGLKVPYVYSSQQYHSVSYSHSHFTDDTTEVQDN